MPYIISHFFLRAKIKEDFREHSCSVVALLLGTEKEEKIEESQNVCHQDFKGDFSRRFLFFNKSNGFGRLLTRLTHHNEEIQ